MLQKGHTGISMLLYAPLGVIIAELISTPMAILCGCIAIGGGGLPDIDTQTMVVKHRGFTHTIYFMIIVGVVAGIVTPVLTNIMGVQNYINVTPLHSLMIGLSASFGVLTHLVGDMITPRGIKPLQPIVPRNVIAPPFDEVKVKYEITNASSDFYNTFFMALGSIILASAIVLSQTNIIPV